MLLGFGYLYKFAMLFFFQKAENNRLKKSHLAKFCNIIFLFLLKIGSAVSVDQQIDLFSPYVFSLKNLFVKKIRNFLRKAACHLKKQSLM